MYHYPVLSILQYYLKIYILLQWDNVPINTDGIQGILLQNIIITKYLYIVAMAFREMSHLA